MDKTPDFLKAVIDFTEKDLLEFLLVSCDDKEIPLFILEAIRAKVYRDS